MQNENKHTIEYVKRQAKKLKKLNNITHTQALELTAKSLGFTSYTHCLNTLTNTHNK